MATKKTKKKNPVPVEAPPPKPSCLEKKDDHYPVNFEISKADYVFPANVKHLLPAEERTDYHMPGVKLVEDWFYKGITRNRVPPVQDHVVEQVKAWLKDDPYEGDIRELSQAIAVRHLSTVLRSFEPKHEHKICGAAALVRDWFVLREEK